jgi:hypothetical protein
MIHAGGHGARPVPIGAAPAPFDQIERRDDAGLRPLQPDGPPPIPTDDDAIHRAARGAIRPRAGVVVAGREGGAGRTTLTRLLGVACLDERRQRPVAVDAVSLWGGLSAAVDARGGLSVPRLASMRWPDPSRKLSLELSAAGRLPVLPGDPPARGSASQPGELRTAVRRARGFCPLTLVDTVADPAAPPARDLISDGDLVVVWVCSASREAVWGVGEAVSYFESLGSDRILPRSIVVVRGTSWRWPPDAAAAEAQLSGRGLEVVRMPRSSHPLTDPRCAKAALRLLAGTVLRLSPPNDGSSAPSGSSSAPSGSSPASNGRSRP